MPKPATTPRIQREENEWNDAFEGTAEDLIAAGIIEQRHLPPQPGRKKGWAIFMPDGTALPPRAASCWDVQGRMSVQEKRGGKYRVEKTVPPAEQQRRRDERPAHSSGDDLHRHYRGTANQLELAGVPARWIAGLPEAGKARGRRTLYEGERRIQVNVGERLEFTILVEHIDSYRRLGGERYARECRAWGLEPSAAFLEEAKRKAERDQRASRPLSDLMDEYAEQNTARSEQQFRQSTIHRLRDQLQRHFLFPQYPRDLSGGFSFDSEAMPEFDDLIEEMVDVFQYRTVLGGKGERATAAPNTTEQIAAAGKDSSLQQFLSQVKDAASRGASHG